MVRQKKPVKSGQCMLQLKSKNKWGFLKEWRSLIISCKRQKQTMII